MIFKLKEFLQLKCNELEKRIHVSNAEMLKLNEKITVFINILKIIF